jgi:hypothetical protein
MSITNIEPPSRAKSPFKRTERWRKRFGEVVIAIGHEAG